MAEGFLCILFLTRGFTSFLLGGVGDGFGEGSLLGALGETLLLFSSEVRGDILGDVRGEGIGDVRGDVFLGGTLTTGGTGAGGRSDDGNGGLINGIESLADGDGSFGRAGL